MMVWSFTHSQASWLEWNEFEFEWFEWALISIAADNASGGNGIPAELFQILNDAAA